jgi:hypothetical protein
MVHVPPVWVLLLAISCSSPHPPRAVSPRPIATADAAIAADAADADPAGRQLAAWLALFNDARRDELAAFRDRTFSAELLFPGGTSHTENASPVPDLVRPGTSADLLALYDYGNASAGLFVFPGVAGLTPRTFANPRRRSADPGPGRALSRLPSGTSRQVTERKGHE